MVKKLPAKAGDIRDAGLIPGLGRSLGGGNGNPIQYSCLVKLHGRRSLVGYSPWGPKELEGTEPAHNPYMVDTESVFVDCLVTQS